MTACIVCSNEVFHGMPMDDRDTLVQVARNVIQGMVSSLNSKESVKNFIPPRRGVCIVERCARIVEAPCEACRGPDCQRCAIAAELRAAEGRINADRDAELVELIDTVNDLEAVIDSMVENLCTDHAAFGAVLAGQWYSRRSFVAAASAPHSP